MRGWVLVSITWVAVFFPICGYSQEYPTLDHPLEDRWVYLSANFQAEGTLERATSLARRAKAAGYNGILLADYKLHVLHQVIDRYFENVEKFKKTADELGLEIIPAVAPFGYSSGILAHDPNLAEAIPVMDVPMVVEGRVARVAAGTRSLLAGGDFEQADENVARGWGFQDEPGKASFIDRETVYRGKQSLRFEELGRNHPPHGQGRISKRVPLKPWRQYHASVWIKTSDFVADETRVTAIDSSGRALVRSNLGVKSTQDWTQHHAVFNSLDNDEVQFYCGAWGGKTGTIWFDDLQLKEIAFLNMVRRDDCPLIVKSETGRLYREGIDFEPLADPLLGVHPWRGEFDIYHEPPTLTLTSKSGIRPGELLRVSYFHTVTVYDGQVACSMEHPAVFDVLKQQIDGVESLLHPQRYMLSHDEIRVANWGPKGRTGERTAGELLAENVQKTVTIIKDASPRAKLCVWSDMFDPFHNAVKGPYYLVNGSYEGSWKGLPAGVTVVNWNSGRAAESLKFFENLGHRQILAGYYDGDPKSIIGWLEQAKAMKSVRGVMYTTWSGNYDHLEAFAQAAWGNR